VRKPLKVLIACPGLGRVRRGFETFADECFQALRDDERLELLLAKGGGPHRPGERRIPNIPRGSRAAIAIGNASHRDALTVEHLTFAAGLLPHLVRFAPHVVLLSEWAVGTFLRRWRSVTRAGFRVLLSNGAPHRPPFGLFDHVQHLTEGQREIALAAGESPDRHSVVPYGFFLPDRPQAEDVRAVRSALGLPPERPIVLSVGALNTTHKRHDHVIEAVSRTHTAPFLVLLGQPDRETPKVEDIAESLLGQTGYVIRSVDPTEIGRYYAATDLFVLGSRSEGFGRVLVEACGAGLRCVVHDAQWAREVLGPWGIYQAMTDPTALAARIDRELADGSDDPAAAEGRRRAMRDLYDWSALHERYVELFRHVAKARLQANNGA
jgi:glycosyltransferase involved in cell wall biosynthesis